MLYQWLSEKLRLDKLGKNHLRMAFPIHPTYFFGEIALFSFIILVLTGIYLMFGYVPSSTLINVGGKKLPASYYSITLINSQPLGLIIRYVHHWAAHLMIAAIILHMIRVYFSGTFKKMAKINWITGVILLIFTIFEGFTGYCLPSDALSNVAANIGYEIISSVPYAGPWIAKLVLVGQFPAFGTVPRLFVYHVVLIPALFALVLFVHFMLVRLPIMLKKGHNQGKTMQSSKIPISFLYSQQLSLIVSGFFLTLSALFLLASFLPVHNVQYYGPPTQQTPMLKPDWYLLWIYGMIKLIPGSWNIPLGSIGAISPEVIGGLILPATILLIIAVAPFFRKEDGSVSSRPISTSLGIAFIVMLIALSSVGYQAELGISIIDCRIYVILLPILTFIAVYYFLKLKNKSGRA